MGPRSAHIPMIKTAPANAHFFPIQNELLVANLWKPSPTFEGIDRFAIWNLSSMEVDAVLGEPGRRVAFHAHHQNGIALSSQTTSTHSLMCIYSVHSS